MHTYTVHREIETITKQGLHIVGVDNRVLGNRAETIDCHMAVRASWCSSEEMNDLT